MSCAFHEINWNDTQGIGYCQFSFRLLELVPYKRPFECLELVIQFGMHSLTVKTYTLGMHLPGLSYTQIYGHEHMMALQIENCRYNFFQHIKTIP